MGVSGLQEHRLNKVSETGHKALAATFRKGLTEVPRRQQNRFITHLDSGPDIDLGVHDDSATVIRLFSFGERWMEEMAAYTEFACDNTDTLIIDLTDNPGGFGSYIDWLSNHLIPEGPGGGLPWALLEAELKPPAMEDAFVTVPRSLERLIPGWSASECRAPFAARAPLAARARAWH